MPRNLRDFWVTLAVDGYSKLVSRGPKRRGGGFDIDINVASHGEPRRLMRISGTHLQNGKNRVIIALDRPLTAGEEVYNTLSSNIGAAQTIVLEDDRECKCLRAKAHG